MDQRSLKDLFLRVKQVLPDIQNLITFRPEMPVKMAITIMRDANFSQVPVVEGDEVLGVFSYRSFVEKLDQIPGKEKNLLNLPVEDFLEDLNFAQITDELTTLFDQLDMRDAVLVGSEDRLQGIITTLDVLRYFHQVASHYILLREIELAIRELIRASVNKEELINCIDRSLKGHYEEKKLEVPTCLEDLNFNDYVNLLRFQGTWEKFKLAFGGSANLVYAKLSPLPNLRNDIFHFKRDITIEEYDSLRDVRDWLLKRIRKIEAIRMNK